MHKLAGILSFTVLRKRSRCGASTIGARLLEWYNYRDFMVGHMPSHRLYGLPA